MQIDEKKLSELGVKSVSSSRRNGIWYANVVLDASDGRAVMQGTGATFLESVGHAINPPQPPPSPEPEESAEETTEPAQGGSDE